MICLIDKDIINPRCLSNTNTPTFQHLVFSSKVQSKDIVLNFLQGQHRYTWLITRWFAAQLRQRNGLEEKLTVCILNQHEKVITQDQLAKVEDQLKEECVWLVSFYDQRMHVNSLSIFFHSI
jgi:hypothetical protein